MADHLAASGLANDPATPTPSTTAGSAQATAASGLANRNRAILVPRKPASGLAIKENKDEETAARQRRYEEGEKIVREILEGWYLGLFERCIGPVFFKFGALVDPFFYDRLVVIGKLM